MSGREIPVPEDWHWDRDALRGIYVETCVLMPQATEWPFPEDGGHSHIEIDDRARGWICLATEDYVYARNGKSPSFVVIHEYAHLLTGSGHTRRWIDTVRKLGGLISPYDAPEAQPGATFRRFRG